MTRLFDGVCGIVFTLEDGSILCCKCTLNKDILDKLGVPDTDGFVDLFSLREIPEHMFDYEMQIYDLENMPHLTDLDYMFQEGGKLSWKHLK